MKLSQLIKLLQLAQADFGDVPVFGDDFRDEGESEPDPVQLYVHRTPEGIIFGCQDWSNVEGVERLTFPATLVEQVAENPHLEWGDILDLVTRKRERHEAMMDAYRDRELYEPAKYTQDLMDGVYDGVVMKED
jgi:hypothetical protein